MNLDSLATIALTIITILLLLLMLTQKGPRVRLLLGILTAAGAVASMVFFVRMQWGAGNPDEGKAFFQIYLPCILYAAVALWGLLAAALSRKRLMAAKAAKQAARAEKRAARKSKNSTSEPGEEQ